MTANAIDEWTAKAILPGSGRYYAILHAEADSQPYLRAIATLISIWSKLCFSNREIEVAQKKVAWWNEELERDTHLHPVTAELQRVIGRTTANNNQHSMQPLEPAVRAQLKKILHGYGSLLTNGSPATDQANHEFHRLTGATATTVFCHTSANSLGAAKIQQAGILLSRLRCLRYLHKHISNGLMCLPMAELEARDIKANQFIPGSLPSPAADYLSDSLKTLEQEFEQCINDFAHSDLIQGDSLGIKSIYIYLHLQLKLLRSMQKDSSNLFLPDIRLAPLRNYWLALRAAGKFDNAVK